MAIWQYVKWKTTQEVKFIGGGFFARKNITKRVIKNIYPIAHCLLFKSIVTRARRNLHGHVKLITPNNEIIILKLKNSHKKYSN